MGQFANKIVSISQRAPKWYVATIAFAFLVPASPHTVHHNTSRPVCTPQAQRKRGKLRRVQIQPGMP